MKKIRAFTILISILLIWSCSKDDETTTGVLQGTISEATSGNPLGEASIIVFNADNNEPTGTILTSQSDGTYSVELEPGNYFLKVYRQGYISSPPRGISAVPFTILVGEFLENPVELYKNNLSDIGIISGKVTDGTNPVGGTLVVAMDQSGINGYSGITDQEGNYKIFNVPVASYNIKGWISGYNSPVVTASVLTSTETGNVDIQLMEGATGTLSGQVRNISVENKDVDIALIHPATKETIPGLTTKTSTQAYSFTNIPDGGYLARATYKNDNRVMDPDRLAKFGEPEVFIEGGNSVSVDFDITGSVQLASPTNEAATSIPVEITSGVPAFEWSAFPGTNDYVIEVLDANGNLIWGGFDDSGTLPVKKIEIPSNQLSIAYNEDGNATIPVLENGRVYRWRIYASKDDQNSSTEWTLISVSEDQRGLIKVVQ